MIENKSQYHVAKTQIAKFKHAIAEFGDISESSSVLVKAQREALISQIATLQQQVRDYETRDKT